MNESKDEFDVAALRLMKELSELKASLADDADHPDPVEVREMTARTIAAFLRREFGHFPATD